MRGRPACSRSAAAAAVSFSRCKKPLGAVSASHETCESPRALGAETERAACLAALRRPFVPFVRFLITEEFRPHALPLNRGSGIVSMLRSARLDHRALGLA